MQNRKWMAALGIAAVVLASPALHGQQPSSIATLADGRLTLTSSSEPAKTAFRDALIESHNVSPDGARARIAAAVTADPAFGLARVYQTVLATGLTPAQREKAIGEAISSMGAATMPELLLALYWRETAAGRGPAALPILHTLEKLVPGDEQIAYLQLGPMNAGKPAAEQVGNFRTYLQKHPNYAATHNSLAYALWSAGDRDGALASVQQYVKLAPMHANSHDSYADILILLDRPQEALTHTRREIEIDPAFGGHTKLGAIHLMMNDLPAARAAFAAELAVTPEPAQRIEPMTWNAVTYVYALDGKSTLRELGKVSDAAKSANAANPDAVAHLRMAVVEAYLGSKKAVQGHLDAAGSLQTPNPNHFLHRAIAWSRIGNAQQARDAAAQFATAQPNAPILPALNALIALDAKDVTAAETALGKTDATDVLTQALRAEVMMRKGQKADGEALRKHALAKPVKAVNNNTVNFAAVVGRMRLAKM